jgi:hypothetical protein
MRAMTLPMIPGACDHWRKNPLTPTVLVDAKDEFQRSAQS